MKRGLFILTVALILGGLYLFQPPSVQEAQADPGITKFCQSAVPTPFWPTVGACVSEGRVCTNNGRTDAVCLCKIFKNDGVLEDLGFRNMGDCVSTLRSLGL